MDASVLTEALKFALKNKQDLREITVRFSDERTVVGYLSKVEPGEVLITEMGAVPFAGKDHKLEPDAVASLQLGLADGSFRNFPG
jgi:hypothetical protein